MKNILIIDDDIHIGNMLEESLCAAGYGVMRAYSGTEALLLLESATFDLVLLDLMLPGIGGEQVLGHINSVPVIVMSAKADIDSKVDLLLGGARDYITKPFNMKELLARIEVQLRNEFSRGGSKILKFKNLELDTATRFATAGGQQVHLTRTEYAVLKLLMQNPAQVVTKSQILDRISADTPDCTESSLKMHISNLRGKLRRAGGRDFIEAVWGIGFKMKEN